MSKPSRKPVPPAKRALMALLSAADRVQGFVGSVIEPHGVTTQQYNVLRILRGAEPEGLPTLAVAGRMMERAPGITRMIDRLERVGLVARERRSGDRRCVYCRITRRGLDLLAGMDREVDATDQAAFAVLNAGELRDLTRLLEKVRARHEAQDGGT